MTRPSSEGRQAEKPEPLAAIESEPASHSPTPHAAVSLDRRIARLFGAYLVMLNVALLWVLVQLWPQSVPMEPAAGPAPVRLLGPVELSIGTEARLLLIVVVAGALGSYIHLATSFADFAGNRRLVQSWLMWYMLRPFIGATLALVVYFALRGGLLVGADSTGALNPYGIAAVAGLTGMFSKQASDKLREVFENLFRTERAIERADTLTAGKPSRAAVAAVPGDASASRADAASASTTHPGGSGTDSEARASRTPIVDAEARAADEHRRPKAPAGGAGDG